MSDKSTSEIHPSFSVGQEIGDQDVVEFFRSRVAFAHMGRPEVRESDVVLSDGFEARLETLKEGRYRIKEIWKQGEDPHRYS